MKKIALPKPKGMPRPQGHPHVNLGTYLHPPKGGKC